MLNVLSILESYSKNGPSTDEVLFSEELSIADVLGSKTSKSTLEAPFGATSNPRIHSILRCMYKFKVQGCFRPAISLLGWQCQLATIFMQRIIAMHYNTIM